MVVFSHRLLQDIVYSVTLPRDVPTIPFISVSASYPRTIQAGRADNGPFLAAYSQMLPISVVMVVEGTIVIRRTKLEGELSHYIIHPRGRPGAPQRLLPRG